MVTKISRRHHYIPKMLLRNFCHQGKLWVGDRTSHKTYPCTPENVFVRKDLNTRHLLESVSRDYEDDGWPGYIGMSDEYEDILAAIESDAAPVIQRIIEQARCRECPKLSKDQSQNWKRFLFAIARRTPESQDRVLSNKDRDIFYEAAKIRADEENYHLPDRETLYLDDRILTLKKLVESNANAKFAAGTHPRTQQIEREFSNQTGLFVGVIRMPSKGFIVGSHGLAIVKPNGRNDPVAGSWLPIAHDVVVKPTLFPDREFLLPLDHKRDQIIRRINQASAAESRFIAGRSEALVRSLMKAKRVNIK